MYNKLTLPFKCGKDARREIKLGNTTSRFMVDFYSAKLFLNVLSDVEYQSSSPDALIGLLIVPLKVRTFLWEEYGEKVKQRIWFH